MARRAYRTRAQEAVLNLLKAEPGRHYTASEIGESLAGEEKPIGAATVYRQLEKLEAGGFVRRYVMGPGESACYAYEGESPCAGGFHCRCEICGRLIHLDCEELRGIMAHLEKTHGFRWNAGKTVFYGICDRCGNA